jgi:hypothetical protein
VTAVAIGASALLSRGGAKLDEGAAVELDAATEASTLAEPSYGPVLTNVLSAMDAAEVPGGWAVLDRRARQIVFLDRSGQIVSTSGGEGDGPGELSRPMSIARVDSVLAVVDDAGTRLDLYGLDARFRSRVQLQPTGCAAAPVRELVGEPHTLALLSLCTRATGKTSALVERVRLSGEREVLLDLVYNDVSTGKIHPGRMPLLTRVGDRLYFAITPERCVTVLEADVDEPARICHPDSNPVQMPDSLKDIVRKLEPRARAVGATLAMPERLPPFDGLLELDGRLAFHVILDDRTHALEVVRGAGRLERILLPRDAKIASGNRGLLLASDRAEGTVFAVTPHP